MIISLFERVKRFQNGFEIRIRKSKKFKTERVGGFGYYATLVLIINNIFNSLIPISQHLNSTNPHPVPTHKLYDQYSNPNHIYPIPFIQLFPTNPPILIPVQS